MAIHNETGGSRLTAGDTDQLDRILLGTCAVLWLAALGAGVAAVVALVALGSGHSVGSEATEADTPWLLYSVIGLSAAVIVGAIPLLLRARRSNRGGVDGRGQARPARSVFGDPVETTKIRAFGGPAIRRHATVAASSSRVAFPTAAVEQVWLRCSVIIFSAIGAATAAIGLGTYLAATQSDTASWFAYGVAAIITVAMPAVPWFYLRELRSVLA
jgi:uncharacterized protein DUF2561